MRTTRRTFLTGVLSSRAAPAFQQRRRPNLVFLLSDDHGPWAWSKECKEIQTPNLDRIASTGTTFTRAYANTPVCSPSRMTLMTGLLPSHHGVQDYLIPRDSTGPEGRRFLEGKTTWPRLLHDAGYTLGLSGKWHMGKDETPQEGFTFWATVPGGGGTYRNAPWIKNGQAMRDSGYKTDAQGDFALEFLNQQKDRSKPFVLYMPFFAPHTPYDFQPERDRDAYAGSKFGCFPRLRPHSRQNPGLLRHFDDEESMRSYSALVTGMDRNVGRVLDQLEKMGAREDTVVVFSADQGYNCGHHGVWGKGNGTVPFNMYEESVRVPLIWSFPGRIAANRRSDAFVAHYDFFPTLLEYLGIEFRQSPAMPGSSYARLLRNQEFRARDRVYFEYCGVRGLRTADVKSVVREKGQFSEFYDIRKDPGETLNLWDSAAHARAREGAERQIGEFFRRVGAPPIDDWRKTTTQNLNVYRAPGL